MTAFVCPACQGAIFHSLLPIYGYRPNRFFPWRQEPEKRWTGDVVRCANPRCMAVSVVGPGGATRLEAPAPQPPPPSEPDADAAPTKPVKRDSSRIFDPDLRWTR